MPTIPNDINELKKLVTYVPSNNTNVLDLSNLGYTGKIPSKIGDLSDLNVLNLSNNNLTGNIPSEIFNLNGNNLTKLDLSNNNLTGNIPSEIRNFNNVTFILINDNCLTIDDAGEKAIRDIFDYGVLYLGLDNNCIKIGTLKGVDFKDNGPFTKVNCDKCGHCKTVPSLCPSNIDDILFPVLPDPEPKPKPKYQTVYNNRTGCFSICKKK